MGILKDRFQRKAEIATTEIKELLHANGNKIIGRSKACARYTRHAWLTGPRD
jgi:hypothetical protein